MGAIPSRPANTGFGGMLVNLVSSPYVRLRIATASAGFSRLLVEWNMCCNETPVYSTGD
jgi:hypothetical protein